MSFEQADAMDKSPKTLSRPHTAMECVSAPSSGLY